MSAPRTRLQFWLAVLLLAAGLWIAFPFGAGADTKGDPVSLTFQEKNGHFDLQASFTVPADPQTVWDTLTDFKYYPKLSPELKKVDVKEESANHLIVVEKAESGFLFITQTVYFQLDVLEDPGKSMVCTDLGHKSFVSYQNRWDLVPSQDGKSLELTYHLQAEGHFGGPAFMVNDGFKGGVKNFVENMRKEILRRQALQIVKTPIPAPTPAVTASVGGVQPATTPMPSPSMKGSK